MRTLIISLLLILGVTVSAATAVAYDDTAFERDLADAYASYRAAASYLRTDNVSIGALELSDAIAKWRTIAEKASSTPPKAYAADEMFQQELARVAAILNKGLDLADAGETKKAFDYLLSARGVLYDLRKRNGRQNYADCVTELNLIMADIIPYTNSLPELTDQDAKAKARTLFINYGAKLSECYQMAPAAYQSVEEFERLYSLTSVSAKQSLSSVERENQGELLRMLGEIISYDRIIFFRFGG